MTQICDPLTPHAKIAQLVLLCRGGGFWISHEDSLVIDEWLKYTTSIEFLMVLLEEQLPLYFEKKQVKSRTLNGIKKKILKQLIQKI